VGISFSFVLHAASRTGDLLRREVLRTVYGYAIPAAEDLVLFKVFPSLQGTKEVIEERSNVVWIYGIEHLPHAGVLRDGTHMKEGPQVVRVRLVLHPSLKLEKGGVLEKHGEGTHADIMDRMTGLRTLASITQGRERGRAHISQRRWPEMFLRATHDETVSYRQRYV
jgi:hypothetical protein